MPDTDDGAGYENLDEEAVAMIEESPSGGELSLQRLGISIFFLPLDKIW